MNESLLERLKHERKRWDNEFKMELLKLKRNFKLFPCPFWELYYEEITKYIDSLLGSLSPPLRVLEAGCGSGKGSLLLKSNIENLTLVDISEEALKLARFFARKIKKDRKIKIKHIQANLFNLPLPNNFYDLTWNAGTLEHYDKLFIEEAVNEMARVTKKGGYLVIGILNPRSLAYKKAKFLANNFSKRWLKFIPGYRIDTEKSYLPEDFCKFFESVQDYNFQNINITYVGSYLLRDTPRLFLNWSRCADLFFKKYKFMYLISARKI